MEAVDERSNKTPVVVEVSTEVEDNLARDPPDAITEVVWGMMKAVPVVMPLPVKDSKEPAPVMVPEEVISCPMPVVRALAVMVKTPVGVVTLLAVMVTALVEPAPASWVKAAATPVEAWVLFCWTSSTMAESARVEEAPMVGAALTILAIEPVTV